MLKAFRNRGKSNEELIDELLSAYLDGVLALEDRAPLEARLQQDPALVTRLHGLRQTKKALASLPVAEVPRNFILSPSMVAPSRPAARPRQRRTWPVFGWATAAVTLLFVLVFAGDFIFARPTPPQPTQVLAQRANLLVETAGAAGAEATVVVEMEAKAAPAASEPGEAVEEEALAEGVVERESAAETEEPEFFAAADAAQDETAAAEPAAPAGVKGTQIPSAESGEMSVESSAAPAEEVHTDSPLKSVQVPNTPTPTSEPTVSSEESTAAVVTVTPESETAEKETLLIASPPAELEQQYSAEPAEIAAVMVTPTPEDGTSTEDVRFWLRLTEAGLGLAVVLLAATTLILRRRQS
jgi:anti-sigma factor RsiW